jgi:hypothetical protein
VNNDGLASASYPALPASNRQSQAQALTATFQFGSDFHKRGGNGLIEVVKSAGSITSRSRMDQEHRASDQAVTVHHRHLEVSL